MTQAHRFTEPALVIDLTSLRRVHPETDPLIQIIPDAEEYEAWLDERLEDQWELEG